MRPQRDAELGIDPVQAPEEIGQRPQRRLVGPVQIVDAQHERLGRRDPRDQPIQAGEDREGIDHLAGRAHVQRRRGQRGVAGHQRRPLVAGQSPQHRLEQLAHDPKWQFALQFGAACPEHAGSPAARGRGRLVEEARLTDPWSPFDCQQVGPATIAQSLPDRRQLVQTADELPTGGAHPAGV